MISFRRREKLGARKSRDDWLRWLEQGGHAPGTLTNYRQLTTRFLAQNPGLKMADITDSLILDFIEQARPASRQIRRGCFANWCGWAYRTRRIESNPMDYVGTYRQTEQPHIECFTDVECKLLFALPEPDGTLMALLLGSGLRRSEATHLTVRRVDLDHAEVHVVEGAKGGHARVVPLSAELVQRLAGYFLTEGLNDNDHLWYRRPAGQRRLHDRPIVGGSWALWWKRCLADAGVKFRKPHTTRHTYATNWRRIGLSMDDVSVLLGHQDIKPTRRVYDHATIYDVRKRMEELIS